MTETSRRMHVTSYELLSWLHNISGYLLLGDREDTENVASLRMTAISPQLLETYLYTE